MCRNMTGCHSHYCKLHMRSARVQLLSMRCNLTKPATQLGLHLKFYRKYTTGYRIFLVNWDMDFCDIMSPTSMNPLGIAVRPLWKRTSNVNHSCPFSGPVIIKDLQIERRYWDALNANLPVGRYRMDLDMYNPLDRLTLLFIQFWVSVTS